MFPDVPLFNCFDSFLGSGVARLVDTVAFNTRDPLFESIHRQILIAINCIGKTNIKKKEASNGRIFKALIVYFMRSFKLLQSRRSMQIGLESDGTNCNEISFTDF